jgi:hypothetical protein
MAAARKGRDDRAMPCVIKLIMDLILGPEEQVAYVSVTTR